MKALEKWVLDEMVEHIKEWRGEDREIYPSDFVYELFENENVSGSYTCSYVDAREWVKEFFDDLDDVTRDMTELYGMEYANPFGETETFQVQAILFIADYLLYDSEELRKLIDGITSPIKFTDALINAFIREWESRE